MRNIHEKSMFGMEFEIKEYSAVDGLSILFSKKRPHPLEILKGCKIKSNGVLIPLSNVNVVNELLYDRAEILPPAAVLVALVKIIEEINFGFIATWKAVDVPYRFVSESKTVSPASTPSIINQLIQDGVATKKELEEYYSLLDAFQMLDIMTAKGVNAAYAQEAADRERKK